MIADAIAFDRGIDDGLGLDAGDDGAGDEGHVGELHAVALLEFILLALADLDDAGHIHLEDGVDVRAGLLGLDHALRDDAAHLGHGDDFSGDGRGEWRRRGRRRNSRRGRRRYGCGLRGCGLLRRGCGGSTFAVLGDEAQDVVFGDASGVAGARAGELIEIDVVVFSDLADEG